MGLCVLICYVPKKLNDDGDAEKGARYFGGRLGSIAGGGAGFITPTATVIELTRAIAESERHVEFLADSTTLMVIGHGKPVYEAINNTEFFGFLRRFANLQSLIFISCELDKRHPELPGFEANIINLAVKSLGHTPKVYASKTGVEYKVLNPENFVWMHTPLSHLVPTKQTTVVRKDPQEKDVADAMDIFSTD